MEPVSNTTGHIDFLWEPASGSEDKQWEFELQGARNAAFEDAKTYYRGADERTFISGLAGGNYFFRIRIQETEDTVGPWSDTLAVEVNYVGMSQVQTLMIIGATCLAATVAIILGGSLRTRRELADRG